MSNAWRYKQKTSGYHSSFDEIRRQSTRSRAGSKAVHFGAAFEDAFERRCRSTGFAVTVMPDGCEQKSKHMIVRVKTPFDFILTKHGRAALVDTKTVEGKTFPHSNIEKHQAEPMAMHQAAGRGNVVGGYVIYFREIDTVCFIAADALVRRMRIRGGSIKPGDPDVAVLGRFGTTGQFDVDAILSWKPVLFQSKGDSWLVIE